MNSHFDEVNLNFSDDEKTWMTNVFEETKNSGTFSPRGLRIRLRGKLANGFRPSSIDERLYGTRNRERDNPRLTLIGTWIVDSDARRVQVAEAVIYAVRDLILDKPRQEDFSAQEVASAIDEDLDASLGEIGRAFADLRDLGSFWSGGKDWADEDEESEGFREISTSSEHVITEYLQFAGFDSFVHSYVRRWNEGGVLKETTRRGLNDGGLGSNHWYVDPARIEELEQIESDDFDVSRLVCLCEELNDCYQQQCHHAVAMLTRAVIDHVPPIFKCDKFSEVANNYGEGSKSFKEAMQQLENMSRKIADAHLHTHIRRRETLPNHRQVDFASAIDVLLGEVVRRLC
jgi:hypothetical protein